MNDAAHCLIELIDDGAGKEALAAIDHHILQHVIDRALQDEDPDAQARWQLVVLLVDAQRSAAIHQQCFQVDGATDCMSFPDGSINPENQRRLVGEVVVCPAVAEERCRAPGHALQLGQELILYILHGALHCLGYDDIDADDRAEMWQRQRELLAPWGIVVEDHG